MQKQKVLQAYAFVDVNTDYCIHKFYGEPKQGQTLEEVKDPTGAGDSFAGGFVGYVASTDDISEANLRKATIFGSTLASFNVEDFSLRRLSSLCREDIAARYCEFRQIAYFEAIE